MISRLSVRNFKSIRTTEIELPRFSVLVGANGSGKSNLIKCLEFIGEVTRSGVSAAVSKAGGFPAVLPKSVPVGELRTARLRLEYVATLNKPWPEEDVETPSLDVRHELELASANPPEVVRVSRESLNFSQPLDVALALRKIPAESTDSWMNDLGKPSSFKIERGPRGGIRYESKPPLNRDSISEFSSWLGLPFLEGVRSKTKLDKILREIMRAHSHTIEGKVKRRSRVKHQSLVDPRLPTILDFCSHFIRFRDQLASVKRYDLLLSELRSDQQMGEPLELDTFGSNLPSVLRSCQTDPELRAGFRRIETTFSSIAPHILRPQASSLRTGREFVEFVETQSGRAVESWESSDGSLRALAILLAVETHPMYGTVLVEEPEQNLHPWAIRHLAQHLREAANRRHLQIVMTTHSEHVLDSAAPDEVVVATRSEADGTVFRTAAELSNGRPIRKGDLGRLWVKGLLGGVPGDEIPH